MRILHPLHALRALFTAAFAIAATAPAAHAVSVTVFWDDPVFGGYGVSQATAQSANAAGIPIVAIPSIRPNDPATDLSVGHALDLSTRVIPVPFGTAPATITSNWSATNLSSLNGPGDPTPDNLYLVFAHPNVNTIELNGLPQVVDYDPADVGLRLTSGEPGSANWVLLQVLVGGGNSVYYPAVSLGTLATGSSSPFQLLYTLDNPQVFSEGINLELGIPSWDLFFASTIVPEPSTALLLLIGLGALAVTGRKRS